MENNKLDFKPSLYDDRKIRELNMADRLTKAINGQSIRFVSDTTGYHPETVRRYLQSGSTIPADFVGQVVNKFEAGSHYLLTGEQDASGALELGQLSTANLINELGRRLSMIEDCAVGSVLVHKMQ